MLPRSALKSQTGYIGLTVVVFLIVLSMILYPWPPPKSFEQGCAVGEAPSESDPYKEFLQLPAVSEMDIDPAIGEYGGGPDPIFKADYVLIRKNVPADSYAASHIRAIPSPQPRPGYILAYPSSDGGKHVEAQSTMDLRIRHEGLIFFVKSGFSQPAKLPSRRSDANKGQIIDDTIQLVDVYQDKRKFNQADKGYEIEDLFQCGGEAALGAHSVTVPTQAVSPDKTQLQLEWFLLQRQGVWGLHCKPAVYLYPEKKQLVNVKVFPKGELTYTDPPYPEGKGWTVEAWPDGSIYERRMTNDEKRYSYLYYETKLLDSEIKRSLPADAGKKPSKGWMVKNGEMEKFLEETLPELGLNEKEKRDFMDYWLTKLPESPYYFVGLVDKSQRDHLETLQVTPNPDTSIRFSLFFEMLDQPIDVEEPLINTPVRNGFTLVDWGGMVKLHPGTPFTCSQ